MNDRFVNVDAIYTAWRRWDGNEVPVTPIPGNLEMKCKASCNTTPECILSSIEISALGADDLKKVSVATLTSSLGTSNY